MALENFIPEIWSARLLETLKEAHVMANVVNRDYEGEISGFGDTVRINSIGNVAIKDYAKNTDMDAAETLDDAQTILLIDQQKYFNFQIDDIDKAQQNPKVMDAAMREAGYGLARAADLYVAGLHGDAGSEVTDAAMDEDTVYDTIAKTAEKLDENNVPREGRFYVVPPFMAKYMTLAEILTTAGSVDANDVNRNGFVGRLLGFDIYMSNNLTKVSDDTMALAGTRKAISYAEQIMDMEGYRPEKRFADAMKGLHVYGAKVVYPNALVRVKIKEA